MMVVTLFPATALAVTGEDGSTGEEQTNEEGTPADDPGDSTGGEDADQPSDETPPPEEPATHLVLFIASDKEFGRATVTDGDKVSAPSPDPKAPESEDSAVLVFLGWYAGGAGHSFDFNTPIYEDLTLYAKFGEPAKDEEDTTGGDITTGGKLALASVSGGTGGIGDTNAVTWTYHFYAYSAEVSTQTLLSGEMLGEPAAPTPNAGERFAGWYIGDAPFTDFGTQTFSVSGETIITAKFVAASYFHAYFHEYFSDGVVEVREPGADNMVSTRNVGSFSIPDNTTLVGWTQTRGSDVGVGDSVEVSGVDVHLYPIVSADAFTITFNSNGGTYVPPLVYTAGTSITAASIGAYVTDATGLAQIEKSGYEFAGWQPEDYYGTPSVNFTLNANWNYVGYSYTVAYWQQNLTGGGYTLAEAQTRYGTPGELVNASASDQSRYTGFQFNATRSDADVALAEDGSTQLNLYYDRINCTILFMVPHKNNGNNYDFGNYDQYNVTNGLYGALVEYWPDNAAVAPVNGYVFAGWYTDKSAGDEVQRLERFENYGNALFVSGTLTLYARYERSGGNVAVYTVNHYLETAPGVWASSATSSSSYTYSKNSNEVFYVNNIAAGYAVEYYSTNLNPVKTAISAGDGVWIRLSNNPVVSTLNVYHARISYKLTVNNGSAQISADDVPYQTGLSAYQPETPARPANVAASAVWAGWYTTQSGLTGSEMDWSGSMPAYDVTVYGVWKVPAASTYYTAIAHLSMYGTGGGTLPLGSVADGATVNPTALSSAESAAIAANPGLTFDGWLQYTGGALIRFSQSAPVHEDLELYPHWVLPERFRITYQLNGAGGTAPDDSILYARDATAQVLAPGSGVTPPVGEVFIGWKSNTDGELYYPGENLIVIGDTVLIAQWADETATAYITYYGNGGMLSDGMTTFVAGVPVPNNTLYTVLDVASVGFVRSGFTFTGWGTLPDGGTLYSPGSEIRLGISSSISGLYAQWSEDTYSCGVTLAVNPADKATGLTGAGDYNNHSDVTLRWTPAEGYETASVTDNGAPVSVSGNSYTIPDIAADHDVVVTLQQRDFELTYVSGNENGDTRGPDTVARNTAFTVAGEIFTYAGHNFLGWSEISNTGALSTIYTPDGAATMPADDLTLYAVWEDATYTVGLSATPADKATGLTGAGTYDYLDDAILSWTPAAGYETVKVEDNGVSVPFTANSYTITGLDAGHNVVVTLEQKDFTLTYAAANGTTDDREFTVARNTEFTVAGEIFTYAGHYFLGWSDVSGAGSPNAAYTPGGTATMTEADLTLYAVWGTKTPLTLTSTGDNVNYDGSTHRVEGFVSSENGLSFGDLAAGASGKDPGEYTAEFTGDDDLVITRDSDGEDVTGQYTVSFVKRKLTINPKVVYVNSINNAEYASEFVAYGAGDATYPEPLAKLTIGGVNYYWDGTYNILKGAAGTVDVTANLTVIANYTQTKTLVITGNSLTVDYTGALQQINAATLSDDTLQVSGYTVHGEGTNVGDHDVIVTLGTVVILDSAGNNVTSQYDVSAVNGTLTINPIDMTVSASGYSGVYNGAEHRISVSVTNPSGSADTRIAYSLSAHSTPEGYQLADNPAITNVDENKTVYYVVTNPNFNPYYGSAAVTLTPVEIEVTAEDKSWTYDGGEHTWPYYQVTSGSFLEGQGISSASFDPASRITNAGTMANTITELTLQTGTDANNYAIGLLPGLLTIDKATGLTVTATPLTTLYTGGEHGVGLSTNIAEGTEYYYNFAGGNDLTTYTKGEYRGVNVADSRYVYVAAVNPNYEPAFDEAQLTINKRAITLTSDTASKVYDGTPLTAPLVTQSGDGFAPDEGFDAKPESVTSLTNAGTLDNTFTVPGLKPGTTADNYTITPAYGLLTVESRTVLIVPDDAEKNFGDPDPAYTYHYFTGESIGTTFYDVLAGDLAGAAVVIVRYDAALPTAEDPGLHFSLLPVLQTGSTLDSPNYDVYMTFGTLTINPQITYLTGTTEAVTGMPAAQWAPYDGSVVLSSGAAAARAGFTLVGWLNAATGTTYALGATMPNVQANVQLTAQWEANSYNVTFAAGTGAAVANMPATITGAAYRSTVTLPAAVPTRAGFTFTGWQSGDVDGTVRIYAAGANFVMPDQAVAFTATWDADTYLVYYHQNFPGGTTAQEGHVTLSTVTVAANSFVRTGYRFLGWSETATGAATRQPGDTFLMPAAEVHLYAQWEQQEYTVSYYVTGGTGTGLDGAQPYATYTGLAYGETMPVPDDPALEGYTFSGWTPDVPATVPEGGLTLNGTLTPVAAAPLEEQIGDEQTPLAGKTGMPLWAILGGSGLLLGLGGFFLFFLLAKRRKDEDEQQGAQ